jgi:hypothetical protein
MLAGGLLAVGSLGACNPYDVVNAVFAEDAPAATSVATCESGMNPGAVSSGGGNHGLFQINSVHAGNFEAVTGQPFSSVYDPIFNTVYAKWLYDQSGWSPWTCQP